MGKDVEPEWEVEPERIEEGDTGSKKLKGHICGLCAGLLGKDSILIAGSASRYCKPECADKAREIIDLDGRYNPLTERYESMGKKEESLDLFKASIRRWSEARDEDGKVTELCSCNLVDCDRLECVKQVIKALDYGENIEILVSFKESIVEE